MCINKQLKTIPKKCNVHLSVSVSDERLRNCVCFHKRYTFNRKSERTERWEHTAVKLPHVMSSGLITYKHISLPLFS